MKQVEKSYTSDISSQKTIVALLRTILSNSVATVTKGRNFSALTIFCFIQVVFIPQ